MKNARSFLGLVVLAFVFQSTPTKEGNKQESAQEKHAVTSTSPAPCSTTVTNNQVCPCKQQDGTENKSKPRPEKSFWGDLPSWALVVVGALAAGIALRTLSDIKKQTGHLGQFAQDTNRIANATLNAGRAWIDVGLGKPQTTIDEMGYRIGYDPKAGEYGRYGIYITNYGRTVARIIDFKVWSGVFPDAKNIDLNKFENRFGDNIQMLFAANHPPFVIEDLDFVALFKDWKSVQDRTTFAVVRIDIRYEDVVRGEIVGQVREPHRTTAVFGWDMVSEEARRLPKYNDYT